MIWLLKSQGMKNCKSTESFCLSILVVYANDCSTFWYFYGCYVCYFSRRFLNVCKPRTTLYPLWQLGPPALGFYGSGLACLQGMLTETVLCDQKISCNWNLSFFKAVPPNRLPFYLGSPLHIISSLYGHFRSWDCPENSIEKVKPGFLFS